MGRPDVVHSFSTLVLACLFSAFFSLPFLCNAFLPILVYFSSGSFEMQALLILKIVLVRFRRSFSPMEFQSLREWDGRGGQMTGRRRQMFGLRGGHWRGSAGVKRDGDDSSLFWPGKMRAGRSICVSRRSGCSGGKTRGKSPSLARQLPASCLATVVQLLGCSRRGHQKRIANIAKTKQWSN